MKKKYLITMLAVAVSAGMMFTGCGNKSEEVAVEAQSTQEIQTEVEEPVEVTEPTTEVVEAVPYGEENGWEFCEEMELKDIPFVAVTTDENDDATEISGISVEKVSSVYKFTNIEELDSDKDGMKKIVVNYAVEINYDVILNALEYVQGTSMSIGSNVSCFEVCDYYSGMTGSYEYVIGDNESTATGQWNWEWNGQVYPISFKCNSATYCYENGTPWENCGKNLYATNCTDVYEVSIEIEAPKEYDGLVLMIPKDGVQEYSKLKNKTTEMKNAMLDDAGNLMSQDAFYIYRVSDIQQKVAGYTTEASNETVGEDYIKANNIKISPLLNEENKYDEDGILSEPGGQYNWNLMTVDVGETETIVTVDFILANSAYECYDFAVEFFDRYTGNNITKQPDVINESDMGEAQLSTRDGYTVSVVKEETTLSEPVTHNSGTVSSDYKLKRVTYKITHPANYDGLVILMASLNYEEMKAGIDAFTSEDYKIMDKYGEYCEYSFCKLYTATNN